MVDPYTDCIVALETDASLYSGFAEAAATASDGLHKGHPSAWWEALASDNRMTAKGIRQAFRAHLHYMVTYAVNGVPCGMSPCILRHAHDHELPARLADAPGAAEGHNLRLRERKPRRFVVGFHDVRVRSAKRAKLASTELAECKRCSAVSGALCTELALFTCQTPGCRGAKYIGHEGGRCSHCGARLADSFNRDTEPTPRSARGVRRLR